MKFKITESEKKRIKDLYHINEQGWMTHFFDLLDDGSTSLDSDGKGSSSDSDDKGSSSDSDGKKYSSTNYDSGNIIEHIKKWEGFVGFTYDDAVYPSKPVKVGERCKGRCTIGYGITDKKKAKPGATVTKEQAEQWLKDVVNQTCIPCIERWQKRNKIEISKPIFDALIDVVYNKGCDGFTTSRIAEKLKNKDIEGAGEELKNWQGWGGNQKRRDAVYKNFYTKGIK